MDDLKIIAGRVLKEQRELHGQFQPEIGEILGLNAAAVSKKEKGTVSISALEWSKLCAAWNVPADSYKKWIDDELIRARKLAVSPRAHHRDDAQIGVPIINKTTAGPAMDYQDVGQGNYQELPISKAAAGDPDAFAVELVGDSMSPAFAPGTICVCAPSAMVESGDPCFVQLNGAAADGNTVKYVYQLADGTVELKPANPRHKSVLARWDHDGGTIIRICKIIGAYAKFNWRRA